MTEALLEFTQPDGYRTHYRLWGPATGPDLVVMLHGGMSHSGWQAPLGTRLAIPFAAVDLRGSGRNALRGHIPAGELAVADIVRLLRHLAASYERIHLAGWCFGAQVATVVAAELADEAVPADLIMVSPGFFFTERYNDVLDRSVDAALAVVKELGLSPEPTRPYIAVPLRASDFTDHREWLDFIDNDPLRLVHVTEATIDAWEHIAVRSEKEYARIGARRVLAVFGRKDRLVDNATVREFLGSHPDVTTHELDTGHAVHFEAPAALAALITAFVEAR
ncbi:alpha/beta fold hydrolase [Actinoplanes sp. N902-109]|uniref:alpha/beta fold hydrolase n=1 Tax=Actinoplanes sp. (strain N902-109) TaxID=649831 RepID=UPI00032963CA|nr:alpha/beta hydrolase [Actinoplanes sp. N902-109]AGL16559.1 putative lysophospholipase [Actinoplanes sp. N902-109]